MILWEKALEFLVSTIGQSVVDTWRRNNGVDWHLLQLRAALLEARCVIERTECWRLPVYYPIDKLLYQLKDSVYEAEIIVDELEYERLKNKVEKSFPAISTIFTNWMRDFPAKVKEIHDRLNKVYNKLEEVCDRRGIPENPNKFSQTARPITSTFLDISNVWGRDKEFNEVVIRLMGVPSFESRKRKRGKGESMRNSYIWEISNIMDKKQNVSVLSIVGMGGIGKTTLAQMVCNDKSVKSSFELIMWVCVFDNYDLVSLTKEMIENATRKECNLTNLNAMQLVLEEAIKSRKFLLVLDDVWSKDWQRVLAPMKEASEGSVVLVTTRSSECVEISGRSIGSRGVINLEGLEEHIYWEFFKSCAFNSVVEPNNISPELEVIGKDICKRLKGSPLAAITIGGALKGNPSVEYWTNIRDSKMWKLQKNEHDILPVLQLSYQYLPTYLKKCFSFCSLYPKDFRFTQSELTEFWIMQGFIGPLDNDKELRTLANGYFAELIRRAFFQRHGGSDDLYVIHDLMHDVCLSITKDECLCLENEQSEQNVSLDFRHLSVFQKKLKLKEEEELCKYKKLLSLKIDPNSDWITGIETWCNVLTNIRSLSLARCEINKLPKNIGNLKHLQFLDISGTYIETLPESICNLYNLRYLNMMDCSKIECFPEGFNKLVNLLLFCCPSEMLSLVDRFENIVKAIQLSNLKLSLPEKRIEILKNMYKLSGSLSLCKLEYVPSKEAAQKAQLNNKPHINRLELEWSRDCFVGDYGENYNEVLDGLCPHRNLKELKISGYRGRNLSPSWLKEEYLPNLTEVEIEWCIVSTISHLPRFITKLVIGFCNQLESLQNLLVPNHLPALKHITIHNCWNLESLSIESFGRFESLEQLEIISCPKLRSPNAMVLPPSVKGLEVGYCGDLEKSIPSCLQNLTSLETLKISGYSGRNLSPCWLKEEFLPNLIEVEFEFCMVSTISHLPRFITKLVIKNCRQLESLQSLLEPNHLPMLKHITVQRCQNLESLSVESFGEFEYLEQLKITWCGKLRSSNAMVLPPSVKGLELQNCGDLEKSIPSCLQNLTSLETLTIRDCQHLVSIPAETTSNLKSLSKLILCDCNKLQSVGGLQFLASLQEVKILYCPKLRETRGQDIHGKLPSERLEELKIGKEGSSSREC